MISSFYNARSGAIANEEAMRVISNNMANVSTTAFKSERMGFTDLLYTNLNRPENELDPVRTGNGVKSQQVTVNYEPAGLLNTGIEYDFAILGRGFFAIRDASTEEIYYTRDGSFRAMITEEGNYLVTSKGDFVLDEAEEPIMLDEETMKHPTNEELHLGVFDFSNQYGLMKIGDNLYQATDQSGLPDLMMNPSLKQGYLENSNVDVATEISRVIVTQRAFQFNSRIIQLADELDQTINNLR